jgi:WD40 repeat protein
MDQITSSFVNDPQIKEIKRILFEEEIYNISYSLEKNLIALGLQNGTIHILDLLTFETLASSILAHNSYIWCSTFTNDGKYLYTGDNSGKIIKTDIQRFLNNEKSNVHTIEGTSDIRCLLTTKNCLISANSYGEITLLDIETNQQQETFKICDVPCSMKLMDDELFITTASGTLVVLNFISKNVQVIENEISSKAVWSFIHLKNGNILFGDDVGQISLKKNENWENLMISNDRVSEMIYYENFLVILSFSGSLLFVDPIDFRVIAEYTENCHFSRLLNFKNNYFITCGVGSRKLFIWYLSSVSKIIGMLKNQKVCDVHFHFL